MLATLCVASAVSAAAFGVRVPADELDRTAVAHAAAMKEHNANPVTSCAADLRSTMPTCKQQGADWCWATGLAEFSFYYNVSTGGASNCTAIECAVVSFDHKMNCCPDGKIRCGGDGESVQDIVKVASGFVGRPFKSRGGPPSEAELVALLQAGTPVMPIITRVHHDQTRDQQPLCPLPLCRSDIVVSPLILVRQVVQARSPERRSRAHGGGMRGGLGAVWRQREVLPARPRDLHLPEGEL